ncbi:MAG: hypothetical protein QXR64_05305 [Pyrobaculum sp.]
MIDILGVVGLFLIAAAWAVNILRNSPPPPIDLTVLYLLGSVSLTIYALFLNDIVFITLNTASSVLSFINLVRALRIKR